MPAMHLKVMRTWAFLDVGSLDGAVETIDNIKENVYCSTGTPAAGRPAYHEGPDGLDGWTTSCTARAPPRDGDHVLTNNWKDFGAWTSTWSGTA
jgi:mannan endo-1,4-beta-mannosidase